MSKTYRNSPSEQRAYALKKASERSAWHMKPEREIAKIMTEISAQIKKEISNV